MHVDGSNYYILENEKSISEKAVDELSEEILKLIKNKMPEYAQTYEMCELILQESIKKLKLKSLSIKEEDLKKIYSELILKEQNISEVVKTCNSAVFSSKVNL